MKPTPILFLSDHPAAETGLGRICRDLAHRLHITCPDIFRVATLGYGSPGTRKLPFMTYYMCQVQDWVTPDLPEVWDDFAGDEPGVIFTIWDASRLLWFARPENPQWCENRMIQHFLRTAKIQKWGYFPIDATGPGNKLPLMLRETVLGFDRVIAYTKWARHILERTLGDDAAKSRALFSLPHGLDSRAFQPQDREKAREFCRQQLGYPWPEIRPDESVIGIVATNQIRKDYGLAFRTVAELAQHRKIRLIVKTDVLERHWSIPQLMIDYGLQDRTIIDCNVLSDWAMNQIYSACDVTLGIGSGEGFGYPLAESLACGTPVVHGDYGGGAEIVPKQWLVPKKGTRLEGVYNCVRPVFDHKDWVDKMNDALDWGDRGKSLLPEHLEWGSLWPKWEAYFREAHRSLPRAKEETEYAENNALHVD